MIILIIQSSWKGDTGHSGEGYRVKGEKWELVGTSGLNEEMNG